MRENMISVIIPVYNTGSKLKFTINSIIQQTYGNLELLLIDDGSTDAKTIDICREYEKNDSRIKVFSKKNEGIEKTRLFGIEKASGDFLIFSDHDDWYESYAFEKLLKTALENNSDVVIANNYEAFHPKINFNKKSFTLGKNFTVDREHYIQKYYKNFFGVNLYPVCTWSKIYKAELFRNLKLKTLGYNFMEDVVLNLQIMPQATTISFIDDYLYYHRFGGLTSRANTIHALRGHLDLYRFKKEFIKKYNLDENYEFINYELKNVLVQMLRLSFEAENPTSNFNELIRIFKNDTNYNEVLGFFDHKNPILNKIANDELEILYLELKNERKTVRFKLTYFAKTLFRKVISIF